MTDIRDTDGHRIVVAKYVPYDHPHGPLREISVCRDHATILKLDVLAAARLAATLLATIANHDPADPYGMRAQSTTTEVEPMDDSYPAEWLDQVPDELDPRLGTVMEVWEPSDGEKARALELWSSYASRNPAFAVLFQIFCDDILRERNLPSMLLAVLEAGTVNLIGCQGEALTIGRLASAVEAARDDALGDEQ